jgi:hypothetical protein
MILFFATRRPGTIPPDQKRFAQPNHDPAEDFAKRRKLQSCARVACSGGRKKGGVGCGRGSGEIEGKTFSRDIQAVGEIHCLFSICLSAARQLPVRVCVCACARV